MLEACLALKRRYWSHDEQGILVAQIALANCLANIGRHDEALLLKREVYAMGGTSHERTILSGTCLAASLLELELWDEAKTFVSDPLLPRVARRSLGADHDTTLLLNEYLARALKQKPEHTRKDPRLNQYGAASTRPAFDLNPGDDLIEIRTIMLDVVQRRRRVFGPARPRTINAESQLSHVHEELAALRFGVVGAQDSSGFSMTPESGTTCHVLLPCQ